MGTAGYWLSLFICSSMARLMKADVTFEYQIVGFYLILLYQIHYFFSETLDIPEMNR